MRIKSFFSDSTDLAIEMARRELGEEALILNSRSSPPEAKHLGAFEVVFAAPEEAPTPLPSQTKAFGRSNNSALGFSARNGDSAPSAQQSVANGQSLDRASNQAEVDLQRQIERLREDLEGVFRNLSSQGILSNADPARGLASTPNVLDSSKFLQPHERFANSPPNRARLSEIPAELQRRLSTILGRPLDGSALEFPAKLVSASKTRIAFVGPAGAGKTSMAVNAALQLGLYQRKSVAVIGIDGERVAANEPLRTYCAIAGLPFFAAASATSVLRLLEEHGSKDLLVLDCPAYCSKHDAEASAMAKALARAEHLITHLVLPATNSFADLERSIEHYRLFSPSALVVSRSEEAASLLPVLAASLAAQLPIRWMNAGQSIPDDFIQQPMPCIEQRHGQDARLLAETVPAGAAIEPIETKRPALSTAKAATSSAPPKAQPSKESLMASLPQPQSPFTTTVATGSLLPMAGDLLNPSSNKAEKTPLPLNTRLPFTAGEGSFSDGSSQQLIEEILRRFRPTGSSTDRADSRLETEHVAA